MTAQSNFNTSDGVRIAYCVDDFTDPWKKAPVLVMLHAAMGSSRRFYSMVPGLARRFRVVRLDTRGHGESQIPSASLTLDKARLAQDVLEALDHLGLDRAHVLGNSAGGYAAQQLAIHFPARVQSLVLYGSAPGFKGEQGKRWMADAAVRGMRPVFGETINDRFPIGQVDQRLVDWFMDEICKNDLAWLARWFGYWTDTEFMDEVSAIACPTLIVAPGAEPIGSVSAYAEMQKRIKNSQLITYANARHNICDYLPDACVADALAFYRRHFPVEVAA
jgi:pimeloyl-ACP methyl ester carboxylesterase